VPSIFPRALRDAARYPEVRRRAERFARAKQRREARRSLERLLSLGRDRALVPLSQLRSRQRRGPQLPDIGTIGRTLGAAVGMPPTAGEVFGRALHETFRSAERQQRRAESALRQRAFKRLAPEIARLQRLGALGRGSSSRTVARALEAALRQRVESAPLLEVKRFLAPPPPAPKRKRSGGLVDMLKALALGPQDPVFGRTAAGLNLGRLAAQTFGWYAHRPERIPKDALEFVKGTVAGLGTLAGTVAGTAAKAAADTAKGDLTYRRTRRFVSAIAKQAYRGAAIQYGPLLKQVLAPLGEYDARAVERHFRRHGALPAVDILLTAGIGVGAAAKAAAGAGRAAMVAGRAARLRPVGRAARAVERATHYRERPVVRYATGPSGVRRLPARAGVVIPAGARLVDVARRVGTGARAPARTLELLEQARRTRRLTVGERLQGVAARAKLRARPMASRVRPGVEPQTLGEVLPLARPPGFVRRSVGRTARELSAEKARFRASLLGARRQAVQDLQYIVRKHRLSKPERQAFGLMAELGLPAATTSNIGVRLLRDVAIPTWEANREVTALRNALHDVAYARLQDLVPEELAPRVRGAINRVLLDERVVDTLRRAHQSGARSLGAGDARRLRPIAERAVEAIAEAVEIPEGALAGLREIVRSPRFAERLVEEYRALSQPTDALQVARRVVADPRRYLTPRLRRAIDEFAALQRRTERRDTGLRRMEAEARRVAPIGTLLRGKAPHEELVPKRTTSRRLQALVRRQQLIERRASGARARSVAELTGIAARRARVEEGIRRRERAHLERLQELRERAAATRALNEERIRKERERLERRAAGARTTAERHRKRMLTSRVRLAAVEREIAQLQRDFARELRRARRVKTVEKKREARKAAEEIKRQLDARRKVRDKHARAFEAAERRYLEARDRLVRAERDMERGDRIKRWAEQIDRADRDVAREIERWRAERARLERRHKAVAARFEQRKRELRAYKTQLERQAEGVAKDIRDEVARLASDLRHLTEEEYVEIVSQLIDELGLHTPVYIPHRTPVERQPALFATVGTGLKAMLPDKETKMWLFRAGMHDVDIERAEEALLKNLRRAYNHAFVMTVMHKIAAPWSVRVSRSGYFEGKTLASIRRELERQRLNSDDFVFVNVQMLERSIVEDALQMEQDRLLGRYTDEALPEPIREHREAEQLERTLKDASWDPRSDKPLAEDMESVRWVAVPREAWEAMMGTVRPMSLAGRVAQRVLVTIPSTIILGLGNVPWLMYQMVANAIPTAIMAAKHPVAFARSVVEMQRLWMRLTPEEKAQLGGLVGIGVFEEQYGASERFGSLLRSNMDARWRVLRKMGQLLWEGVPVGRYRRLPLNPVAWLFELDKMQTNFFRRAVFATSARYRLFEEWAQTGKKAAGSLEELVRRGLYDDTPRFLKDPDSVRLLEQAARDVNKLLGDYMTFTPFERRWLRAWIPFYAFLRYSLEFLFTTLPIYHPGVMVALAILGRAEQEELKRLFGSVPPIQMLGNLYYVDPDTGEPQVISVARANPLLNQITQAERPWQLAFGLMSPTLTIPMSALLGRDLYRNRPLVLGGESGRDVRYDPWDLKSLLRVSVAMALRLVAPIREYMRATSKYPGLEAADDLPWDRRYRSYSSEQGKLIMGESLDRAAERLKDTPWLWQFLLPFWPQPAKRDIEFVKDIRRREEEARFKRAVAKVKQDPLFQILAGTYGLERLPKEIREIIAGTAHDVLGDARVSRDPYVYALVQELSGSGSIQGIGGLSPLTGGETPLTGGKSPFGGGFADVFGGGGGGAGAGGPFAALALPEEPKKQGGGKREAVQLPGALAALAPAILLGGLGAATIAGAPARPKRGGGRRRAPSGGGARRPVLAPARPAASPSRRPVSSVGAGASGGGGGGGGVVTPAPLDVPGGGRYVEVARAAAEAAGIDPDLFVRQIAAESGFNPNARSPAGAIGIAQIMPATARGWGVDPRDPVASLYAAARAMANYLRQFGGDWRLALAAYNAGPGNARRALRSFPETRAYVQRILGESGTGPGDALARGASLSAGGETKETRLEFDRSAYERALRNVEQTRLISRISRSRRKLGRMAGDPSLRGTGLRERSAGSIAADVGVLSFATPEPGEFLRVKTVTVPAAVPDVVGVGGGAALTPGGGYAGTEGLIRSIPTFGLAVTSEKRARVYTDSGKVSDHYIGNRQAFARDLAGTKAQMDRAFAELSRFFGRKLRYNTINVFSITRGGRVYRIQVIYGPAVGHGDHIHVGARRVR